VRGPVRTRIASVPHLAHASRTDARDDFEGAELCARLEGHLLADHTRGERAGLAEFDQRHRHGDAPDGCSSPCLAVKNRVNVRAAESCTMDVIAVLARSEALKLSQRARHSAWCLTAAYTTARRHTMAAGVSRLRRRVSSCYFDV
jgi:hypothetical protein